MPRVQRNAALLPDWGKGLLHLYRMELPSILYHEVYLPFLDVPVEPYVPEVAAGIHLGFQDLIRNEGLEEMFRHCPTRSGNRVCPAQKIADKAGIHKEELRPLGKTLVWI